MQHDLQFKLTRQLKQALIRRGLTMKQMASHIGISAGQLSKVLSCGSDMSADKWQRACQFVGWEYDEHTELAIIPQSKPYINIPVEQIPTAPGEPELPYMAPEGAVEPSAEPSPQPCIDQNNLKEDIPMPSNDNSSTITISLDEAQLFMAMIKNSITNDLSSGFGSCTFEQLRKMFDLYARLEKGVTA